MELRGRCQGQDLGDLESVPLDYRHLLARILRFPLTASGGGNGNRNIIKESLNSRPFEGIEVKIGRRFVQGSVLCFLQSTANTKDTEATWR